MRRKDGPIDLVLGDHLAEKAVRATVKLSGKPVMRKRPLQKGQARRPHRCRAVRRGGDHPRSETVTDEMNAEVWPQLPDILEHAIQASPDHAGAFLHLVVRGEIEHAPCAGLNAVDQVPDPGNLSLCSFSPSDSARPSPADDGAIGKTGADNARSSSSPGVRKKRFDASSRVSAGCCGITDRMRSTNFFCASGLSSSLSTSAAA